MNRNNINVINEDNIINNSINKNEKENSDEEDTFLGLKVGDWGFISTFTNGFSVAVQLFSLLTTFRAQSFSMNFIWLMILLNFVYFLVALLDGNLGFTLATFFFVCYNIIVVIIHHCGYGGSKIDSWFHRKITKHCKPIS